jgi:hypothetical protein
MDALDARDEDRGELATGPWSCSPQCCSWLQYSPRPQNTELHRPQSLQTLEMQRENALLSQYDTPGDSIAPKSVAGQWTKVNEAMSERAAAYQTQITGRTGESFVVDGVKFDGVGPKGLVDAKGPGYAKFVKDGKFQPWFKGKQALLDQAERQIAAANGTPITWHAAEAEAATAIQNLLRGEGITAITVVHTPPVP